MIANSTIAANTEAPPGDAAYGAGIYVGDGVSVDLQSAIVASNWLVQGDGTLASDDVGGGTGAVLAGANNLIQAVLPPLTAPAGTIDADPMLFALNDNGGATWTHALMNGSPALDTGNNAGALADDQRGTGFARVVGAAADIGAFERQGPLRRRPHLQGRFR